MPPFEKRVQRALMSKGSAPEELNAYLTERKFWKELGIPATDLPLDQWEIEKAARYETVIDAVAAFEVAEMKRQQALAEAKAAAAGRK